jgi:PAS domain S-box-containing protein
MLRAKNNKSITRIFLYSMIFISFVSTALIGYLWISHESRRFDRDSEKMRAEYIESQKLLVKNEVNRVVDYIGYMRSRADRRLTELLKEKFAEADGMTARGYREKFIKDLQRELLEYICKVRFGKEGYIFVVDFDGTTLWNEKRPELVGKKVWAANDPGGADALRQARETVQTQEGGFIRYNWFKQSHDVPIGKTSFVQGIKDWQWIIGAGVYVDEIDRVIAGKRVELQRQVTNQVTEIIVLFLVIFAVVIFITLLFSGKLRKEVGVFLSFFRKAAISHEKIDKDKLFAEEFKELADSANRMLEERQKIENSLRDSEERLAVTFRSIAEGVITVDTAQKVVLINQSAGKLMGWCQEEAIGKPLDEVFKIIDEETKAATNPFITGAAPTRLLISRDSTRRLISYSTALMRDIEGNSMGWVIVFQDITEKKRMEEELQKAHKLEALGLLAGGIAHDFNNLLTGILGNINLAKTFINPGDKIYDIFAHAEKAANKARGLTQRLLTFARGSAPIKEVHAPAELIRESVLLALRGSNVECRFSLAENLQPVEADKDQLNLALGNLIINAVQAMPGGGTIDVSADNLESGKDTGLPLADRKYVKIAIKDHGIGIPGELLEKIFDPYFTTKARGSGLGLTTAYSIIKKHDGYIHVESQPGKGSVFTVYIPAPGPGLPTPVSGVDQSRALPGVTKEADEGGRILVMEDDRLVREVAVKMLSHLGYQVEVAVDGRETIDRYKKSLEMNRPYDVVIMDLTIPGGMGGTEAIKKLMEINPQVKAIVSSGYSNDPVMADFRQYGFQGFIRKPFMLVELKKTLDQVLAK